MNGADAGGGSTVRTLAVGAGFGSLTEVSSSYTYNSAFIGVRVAAGDLDATVALRSSPERARGGPHVQAFQRREDGALSVASSCCAYAPAFVGGVFVAAARSQPCLHGQAGTPLKYSGVGPHALADGSTGR